MSKIRFYFAIIVVSIVLMLIPVTAANQNFSSTGTANASSDTYYFITIDPIGNHTVDDVFFINGTTNLPVTELLIMDIYNFNIFCCTQRPSHVKNDACSGLTFTSVARVSDFLLSTDLSGPNRFSLNVTDTFRDFESGEYVVFVCSNQTCSAGLDKNGEACLNPGPRGPIPQKDFFTLFPATNISPTMVPRTTMPSPPLIQPTTSQALMPPTTQSSPLPFVLPIVVLSTMVILILIVGKKRV